MTLMREINAEVGMRIGYASGRLVRLNPGDCHLVLVESFW